MELAKIDKTFRLLAPGTSEVYTTDTRNIEHVLKTQFNNYLRGKYDGYILTDLLGEGIFNVNGEKWRQQRRLASYEFTPRVLRDYSSSAFRTISAKVVRLILGLSQKDVVFDMQVFTVSYYFPTDYIFFDLQVPLNKQTLLHMGHALGLGWPVTIQPKPLVGYDVASFLPICTE